MIIIQSTLLFFYLAADTCDVSFDLQFFGVYLYYLLRIVDSVLLTYFSSILDIN